MSVFTPSYPFVPHPQMLHQHVQTTLGTLLPRRLADAGWLAAANYRELVLPDGDRLATILHLHPDDPERRRPLVILMHGLEGSMDSHYVRGMSAKAYRMGFHSLRLAYRGCGGTEHLSRRLYNGAMIEDMDHVVRTLAAEGPWPIVTVGVSLGANKLLRLLSTYGDHPPEGLVGAVAISAPIDLIMVSKAFEVGFNRVYDQHFMRKLKRKLRRRIELYGADDPELARRSRAGLKTTWLREVDKVVTAPEGGFASPQDYYLHAGVQDGLAHIGVPTLIVHAQDDPLIPMAMYEQRAALIEANPHLTTIFTSHGGHVGFLEQPKAPRPEAWMDEYWAENQALAYVRWICEKAGPRGVSTATPDPV